VNRPVEATSVASAAHYLWGADCEGWRLVDREDLSVIEELLPVGAHEIWHVHDRARQFFYVTAGEAELRTVRGTATLGPGSGVEVAPGVAHQFANVGDTVLRLLVVSAPRTRDDRRELDEPARPG